MNINFESNGTRIENVIDQDSTVDDVLRCVVGTMVSLGYAYEGILESMKDISNDFKYLNEAKKEMCI